MITKLVSIVKLLMDLVGWGTKQVDRAQDKQAGRDAATVEFQKGDRALLEREIAAREEAAKVQMEAAQEETGRKAKLRDDPNNIFLRPGT